MKEVSRCFVEADEEFCQILAAALANNDTYGLKGTSEAL